MKIVKLKAENFMRLACVEITPDGNVVKITGGNKQGKTSVINAIAATLGGKKLCPAKPIRTGEDEAEVMIDLGDIQITRKWKQKNGKVNTYLEVEGNETGKTKQELLDDLLSRIAFDPTIFIQASPVNQRQMLLDVFDLDPDWSAYPTPRFIPDSEFDVISNIDNDREKVFKSRADINRQVRDIIGTMNEEKHELPDDEQVRIAFTTEIPIQAIMDEKQKADENNRILGELEGQLSVDEDKLKDIDTQIENLKADAERLNSHNHELCAKIGTMKRIPVEDYETQIMDADKHNKCAHELQGIVKRVVVLKDKKKSLESDSEQCTNHLEMIDAFKLSLLSDVKFPVDGLTINNDGVMINDIPLEQCSHSEKLRIGMAIAMAQNPDLKVILMRDGEKFENDAALIDEIIGDSDYQIWIEDARSNGGIRIDDGMVAS